MPNWFNHTSKNKGSSERSLADISDRELMRETADKEMKKNLLKILMITTNQTRMQMAEEIATEFDCTMSVSYIDKLKAEIKEENEFKLQEQAQDEIRKQYMEMQLQKHELWKAWRMSFQQEVKVREEVGETPKGNIDKTTTTTRDRLPDAMYQKIIKEINKDIRDLLGMTKQLEMNIYNQQNNFNVLSSGAPEMVPSDHDMFTKKPKEISPAAYTSIDDDDLEVEEAEGIED